jgi:hypothetical protein
MEKTKCKRCGKEIEGYSKKHVEYLMMQHDLIHREEKKEEEKNGN